MTYVTDSRDIIYMFFISQVPGLVVNFNIRIYSDTMNMVNVKLCMVALLSELYLFIPHSVTLAIFQSHSSVEQFQLKILCAYPVKLKWCRTVK